MVILVPYPQTVTPDLDKPEENAQFLKARAENEIRVRGESWSASSSRRDFVPKLDLIAQGGTVPILTTRKFILQGVEEGRAEKHQIVQTFGENFIFLFGQQPLIFNYSGTMLDARSPWRETDGSRSGSLDSVRGPESSNWVGLFDILYDKFLRGYSAASQKMQVRIQYKDYIRTGILLNFSKKEYSDSLSGVPFSFAMYVLSTNYMGYDGEEHAQHLARIYAAKELNKALTPQVLALQTGGSPPVHLSWNANVAASASYMGVSTLNENTGEAVWGIPSYDGTDGMVSYYENE